MSNWSAEQKQLQQNIRQELGVKSDFRPKLESDARLNFLADKLINTKAKALVVGVSGGVDSLLAGCLARLAVKHARGFGVEANLIALRLPYGKQADADDAQACLDVIKADQVLDINIKSATDSMLKALIDAGHKFNTPEQQDFIVGNIKARQRMLAQYAVAGTHSGLVVGTDQAAETLMGFSTKYGDNAADVMPLWGLNKRQVRSMAGFLGAPESLVFKVPTADLESLSPLKPDELAMGVTYDQVDDFLEGKEVDDQAYAKIIAAWERGAHKRNLPDHQ